MKKPMKKFNYRFVDGKSEAEFISKFKNIIEEEFV